MGRTHKPENQGLPPGMTVRSRESGDYFYLSVPIIGTKKRKEVSLGKNKVNAFAEYRLLTGTSKDLRRSVHRRPWLAQDLFSACRANAKRRGIEFTLSQKDVEAMLEESNGKCSLTGISFDLAKQEGIRRRPWMPSIDRVDSKLGYQTGNVRLVAASVNVALNDFGEDILVQISRGIIGSIRGVRL